MSLVMAIKKDGVVYLGADTRSTRGAFIESIKSEPEHKITRIGNVYVGSAGSVSNVQIMISHPEWFNTQGKPLTKKFLVQNVVGKYYDELERLDKLNDEGGSQNNREYPKSGGIFIVTDGDSVFLIDSDFEVVCVHSGVAIGCTKTIAIGYILSSENEEPNDTILRAMRESSWRNKGVGAPYVLVNTRDNEFITVEE